MVLHFRAMLHQMVKGRSLTRPFLKIEEKCPDVGKKYPVRVRLEFKFSHKKAVLRVSWGTNTKIPPHAGQFFCMPYMKSISKCSYFKKPPLA